MKTRFNTLIKIIPWLIGFLLSTAGMSLGYVFGSDTASLMGGEPGIWARLSKGFVWGGVISCLQWPIVRAVGVSPLRLILAGAVGFAVGYPFGQTVQGFFIYNWNLHLTGYWLCIITFSLFLGVPQWLILRQQLKLANLWILLNVSGWLLRGLLSLNGGMADFGYGIVTGLGLVWLVHSEQTNRSLNESVNSTFIQAE
ncbi:MAG: hypothetical protein IPJ23_05545 [Ignavibacteriales bacterium]|nr:hypothetical protein [Ignavibacteriales bacterium]